MDKDMVKGKWRELVGGVKEKWGKLTDDELAATEGKKEKLMGLLQSRYGWSREQAEREYRDFMDRHRTGRDTKTGG